MINDVWKSSIRKIRITEQPPFNGGSRAICSLGGFLGADFNLSFAQHSEDRMKRCAPGLETPAPFPPCLGLVRTSSLHSIGGL
jgi:hypothetical protein